MRNATPEMIEMYTILVIGLAAVGLGVPGVLLRRRESPPRPPWKPALLLAFLLAVGGGGAALAGLPRFAWLPPLALAPVWLAFAVLRTGWPTALCLWLARLATSPRTQAASVILAGGALLTWQTYDLTRDVENQFTRTDALLAVITSVPPLEEDPEARVLTDAGQFIPMWRVIANSSTDDFDVELDYLQHQGYEIKLIRTAPPDLTHNCHGWVFTGGKRWIRGAHVEQILKDNRYLVVSSPAPGDVAIFRTSSGIVSHTALVRSVSDDGTILLESKWGKLGRFIHTASEHVYAIDSCTYYRSTRGSHVVQMSKPL